jgi:hypothetical protein
VAGLERWKVAAYARRVRGAEQPQATGEDGRIVLEALYAGYQSAGTGTRVSLPFRPEGVRIPIDLWKPRQP